MQPVDIMRATDVIGSIGAAFYFLPETIEVGKANGLSGFRFYVAGRGGVLGDVDADVVRAAFSYFEPTMLRKLWETSLEMLPARRIARLYLGCALTNELLIPSYARLTATQTEAPIDTTAAS